MSTVDPSCNLNLHSSGTEAQVSVTGIRLTLSGKEVPYMNLGSPDLNYVLECNYAANDGDIVNVTWTLDDYGDVYSWNPSTDVVTGECLGCRSEVRFTSK